jgi:ABC-type transport system involved in multi-copper enzyme maturation permease subunit
MSGILGRVAAQVTAEAKTRLRSSGTLVAITAIVVASSLAIPDPATGVTSVSWRRASDGNKISGIYNSGYVGTATAILASTLLPFIGFYLVAGSVRRDRESGVGAILAATPLSRGEYLLGKFAAHVSYLMILAGIALAAGLYPFLRYGTGPFLPIPFVSVFLLLVTPALALTAAFALLFDVTPGLRHSGGHVLYFVIAVPFMLVLPLLLVGDLPGTTPLFKFPVFDPSGIAALHQAVYATMPDVKLQSIATGWQSARIPVERTVWNGIPLSADLVAARAVALVCPAILLPAAVLIFDRFDPARTRRPSPSRPARDVPSAHGGRSIQDTTVSEASPAVRYVPTCGNPSAWRAIGAETRLLWRSASPLKWLLLLTAVGAGIVPGPATAAFLLLLTPAISEAAARERIHGTAGLVFSHPGIPSSPVLWKTAATGLFVFGLATPATVRAFAGSWPQGLAFATGLLFVVALSTSAGYITGDGRLFTATYAPLWYAGLSGGAADFSGSFGGRLDGRTRLLYVAAALLAFAFALAVERWRRHV